MPSIKSAALVAACTLIPQVLGHGWVWTSTWTGPDCKPQKFDGTEYGARPKNKGPHWEMLGNTNAGPTRPNDYNKPNIICGLDSRAAKTTVKAVAGTDVVLDWHGWPKAHEGAILTYMAECPGSCSDADMTKLKFWKLEQEGKISADGSKKSEGQQYGYWATDKLKDNKYIHKLTIPKQLKPANYLMRHEIIMINGAQIKNGAQHFPQCMNVEVLGNGTVSPPGVLGTELYDESQPGTVWDISKKDSEYPIPGPPLFQAWGKDDLPDVCPAGSKKYSGDEAPKTLTNGSGSGNAPNNTFSGNDSYGSKVSDGNDDSDSTTSGNGGGDYSGSTPSGNGSSGNGDCSAATVTVTATVTATPSAATLSKYSTSSSSSVVKATPTPSTTDSGSDSNSKDESSSHNHYRRRRALRV